MIKKTIIGIVIVIAIIAVGIGVYLIANRGESNSSEGVIKARNQNENTQNTENLQNEGKTTDETNNGASKILVVYYSAQSHTEVVAKKIAENLNADIFEIIPEEPYTSSDLNYNDDNSRVVKEYNDESLRDVKLTTTEVENWEEYDTVLIGYPIWWGIAAWPVNAFVKANDFTGKTVIPFCTSASSSLGQSGDLLEEYAGTGNWVTGHRFSSNASDSDIKEWTDSLL